MCTSLLYRDAADRAYVGRTLELSLELPYAVAFFPKGLRLSSRVAGHPDLGWRARHASVCVTMPAAVPGPGVVPGPGDLKVIEGLNDAGLAFSVQSYPLAVGPRPKTDPARPALSAIDLGTWTLGQFAEVSDVRAALEALTVVPEPVAILGGLEMPFHYAVRDARGNSLVVEFHAGARSIYDNPVGVMTNAPRFPWHLTNLDNYTFLGNTDRSRARFGALDATQPGSGIAKAGLPETDTSVDRFIRAAYYAQFAEKQADPDEAVRMVAHIMNNFDRPRGITIDPPNQGSGHLHVEGQRVGTVPTEFTSWTSLSDLDRRRLFLRDSGGMNYACLDVTALAEAAEFHAVPMAELSPRTLDATAAFAGR